MEYEYIEKIIKNKPILEKIANVMKLFLLGNVNKKHKMVAVQLILENLGCLCPWSIL